MLADRMRRDIGPLKAKAKVKTLPFCAAPCQNTG